MCPWRKADKSKAQKSGEAEVEDFQKDLGPFVIAAKTTRMPLVFTDAKRDGSPIVFANDSFLSLSGYERDEVLGQRFDFLMEDGADAAALAKVRAMFEGTAEDDPEMACRRKNGDRFWAAIFISPVVDASGDIVQHFGSFMDVTRHRREQARSRMLIDELNHRVKNTLSTVQSIAAQALRTASAPEGVRDAIESRLLALSRSHDLLTHENWESAGLLDLVNQAMEPFGVADGLAEGFIVAGKNIRLPPKATLALGIAFYELATNAVRYGAFSNAAGSILIGWTMKPSPAGRQLVLRWQEHGGPPVPPPSRKEFGSRVIERGLVHELGGSVRLDYRAEGVVCTIEAPAP